MNQEAGANAICTLLETLVTSPALPFVYENQAFKPEADGGEYGWIYTEIEYARNRQITMGSTQNFVRNFGAASISVVVPRGDRIGRARGIAQDIHDLFKMSAISDLHITGRWIGGGRLTAQNSRWYALPVLIEFWTDHLETPA